MILLTEIDLHHTISKITLTNAILQRLSLFMCTFTHFKQKIQEPGT